MKNYSQALSEDERSQVHEQTLRILARTGVTVETSQGRRILKEAGAEVDENSGRVRFPRALVEASLRQATKDFTLGARRPNWDFPMNKGECRLTVSGQGTQAIDRQTGEYRNSLFSDVMDATRLADALDDIGSFGGMVTATDRDRSTLTNYIDHLLHLFRNFSKHISCGVSRKEQTPWLFEVLQVVFGDKETIRKKKPISCTVCPQSPLMIDDTYTDAYLTLKGWGIPVVVMPMPIMGATAPASLISTVVIANCEVVAMLCLLQAAEPGVPVIYAPVSSLMDPRTGLLMSGAAERGLLSAAAIEMARFYGLPAETCGASTSQYTPGIQAAYERALNTMTPMLSGPDILAAAGLLGSAMILSLEQMLMDSEVFRLCKRAHQGISSGTDMWLEEVIEQVGPGGHFMDQPSTLKAVRGDEWYISNFGVHCSFEDWDASGRRELFNEAREEVDRILRTHQSLPLDEDRERELERIQKKAQETEGF